MKKVLAIILILFILIPSFAFANGKSESPSVVVEEDEQETAKTNFIRKLVLQISNWVNWITVRLTLTLSPFPAVTAKFYEYSSNTLNSRNDNITDFSTDEYLLVGSGAYEYNNIPSDLSDWLKSNDSTLIQQRRWGLVFYLVLAFTVMEILYMIVFPQNDRNGEGVDLKAVVIKILHSFLIILLLSALPFLLEIARYGFTRVVEIFAKENNASSFTMVTMPGHFAKQMADILSYSSPVVVLQNSGSISLANKIGEALVSLLYLIFQFCMLVMVFSVVIHIMVKLIEVYLLLTLCMFTMPFSVFTPLKTVGEKSALSLVANTLECFIIAIILAVVVPGVNSLSTGVIESLAATQDPLLYEVAYVTSVDLVDPQIYNSTHMMKDYEQGIIYRFYIGIDSQSIVFYINKLDAYITQAYGTINEFKPDTEETFIFEYGSPTSSTESALARLSGMKTTNNKTQIIPENFDSNEIGSIQDEMQEADDKKLFKDVCVAMDRALMEIATGVFKNKNIGLEEKKSIKNLILSNSYHTGINDKATDKITNNITRVLFLNAFENILKGKDFLDMDMIEDDAIKNYRHGVNIDKSDINNLIIRQFIFVFIGVFIPCFFIRQSGSITSMVLSGTVSQGNAGEDVQRAADRFRRSTAAFVSVGANLARALIQGRREHSRADALENINQAINNRSDGPQNKHGGENNPADT